MFLKPTDENGNEVKRSFGKRLSDAIESSFNAVTNRYLNGVSFFLRHKALTGVLVVAGIGLLVYFMNITKTGLIPREDIGTVRIDVSTAPGSSLAHTKEVMDRIDRDIVSNIDECHAYLNMAGFGMTTGAGTSYGNFTLRLKHWDERKGKEHSVFDIMDRIKDYSTNINDATLFTTSPAMIPGYGATNGFELHIQDRKGGTIEDLANVVNQFVAHLNECPEIGSARTSFNPKFPQYQIDVDAVKCKRAGTSPKDVLNILNGYYGGRLSTRFNRFTKLYQVQVQADPRYRVDLQTLNNIFIRIGDDMAPISQFVTLKKIYAPENLARFNMFPSIAINGRAADGYSSGDAIAAVNAVAKEVLPIGYGFDFGGIAREEAASGNNTVIIFVICITLIYLILCALYESFFIPFAVILTVPIGLFGSFAFANMMGLENNIYLQTGLIMLIGLLSKTAILITEYAAERRRQGLSIFEAAYEASKDRFRPIMMTVLTMVFGMIPLMFSTGVGANGNNTLGAGVVGGMFVGTLALIFLVPALFIVFQTVQERVVKPKQRE
jgi:HAE1 family hydrophobic/amphiphilic exporter-1